MTRSHERALFLQDVLITAVEGGTGYWASVSDYHWDDDAPDTARATLHDMEEDDREHRVTIDTIASGVRRIVHGEVQLNLTLRTAITYGSLHNDAGDIDADCADAIVQAALFGEVVYG